jgi:hypothetical protein
MLLTQISFRWQQEIGQSERNEWKRNLRDQKHEGVSTHMESTVWVTGGGVHSVTAANYFASVNLSIFICHHPGSIQLFRGSKETVLAVHQIIMLLHFASLHLQITVTDDTHNAFLVPHRLWRRYLRAGRNLIIRNARHLFDMCPL